MEYHQICRHVLLRWHSVTVLEIVENRLALARYRQCRPQGIETAVVVVVELRHVDAFSHGLPAVAVMAYADGECVGTVVESYEHVTAQLAPHPPFLNPPVLTYIV